MTLDDALRAAALLFGLFAAMSGTAFFLAGLLPGASAAWWKQYGWSAVALTAAFYLLSYAFSG
jgi:uncharacterized membrane protein YqjE